MKKIEEKIEKFLNEATPATQGSQAAKKDDDLRSKIADLKAKISKAKPGDKQVDGWKERVKKLEDRLKGKKTNEAYVEEDDEIIEAQEMLDELVKAFGGRKRLRDDNSVVVYPFKRDSDGDWDVTVEIWDDDPMTFAIDVHLMDEALYMGGSFSILTDTVDIKVIEKIGLMQKKYYETIQSMLADAKRMGKLERS